MINLTKILLIGIVLATSQVKNDSNNDVFGCALILGGISLISINKNIESSYILPIGIINTFIGVCLLNRKDVVTEFEYKF